MLESNQRLPDRERLKSKKEIEKLFSKGFSFFSFPFKILISHENRPSQYPEILITVPKKNFKKAVDRNHHKRLIREAYRLHKHSILAKHESQIPLSIAFIFVAKKPMDFHQLKEKLVNGLPSALQAYDLAKRSS